MQKKIWNWISCKIFWKLFTKEFFELFMVSDLILNVFLFIITIIMHMRVLVYYIVWYQEINHNKHRANSQPNDFEKITSIYIFFNILYWKKWESTGYSFMFTFTSKQIIRNWTGNCIGVRNWFLLTLPSKHLIVFFLMIFSVIIIPQNHSKHNLNCKSQKLLEKQIENLSVPVL